MFGYMAGDPAATRSQPVWLGASGKVEPVAHDGALSPDGKLIAKATGAIGVQNIKVWDTEREVLTSVTSDSLNHRGPLWAPDGRHLVWTSRNKGTAVLWWGRADGGGQPHKLLQQNAPTYSFPGSFSPDGRLLAYHDESLETSSDIWILPLDLSDPEKPKAGTPVPFIRSPATELRPVFSPDGKWIAYGSQESGTWEVYVRPYPGPGGRWQISAGDGYSARWSRKRKQILYSTVDGRILVSDYEVRGDTFVAGKPRLWTERRIGRELDFGVFDLSPDGERILTSVNPNEATDRKTSVHATLLFNFLDELKRRVP